MSREIRRLHRKKAKFTNFSNGEPSEVDNLPESNQSSLQENSDDARPLPSQIASSVATAFTNDINSIRAEFIEDTYHCELNESDFSDDTHDWGDDDQSASVDYWHFVGSFE